MSAPISAKARTEAIAAFNQGVRAMQEGRSEEAAQLWESAYTTDPTLVPAARNLIVFREERGQYDEVARIYGRLLSEDPFDTESLVRQAAAFSHSEQYDQAVANYERAISIYPYFRFWYEELAEVLDKMGKAEDAALWRDRGNSLDADEAEMAFEDGIRNLKIENYPLAIACFEAIIEEYPANLDARMRLASAYIKADQTDDALEQYTETIEMTDAAQALVLFRRAQLYLQMGNTAKAKDDLELALGIQPEFGRASRMLGELSPAGSAVLKRGTSLVGAEAIRSGVNESPRRSIPTAAPPPTRGGTERLRPLQSVNEEIEMLDVSMIEVEDAEPSGPQPAAVQLRPPPRNSPWEQQLLHVFQETLKHPSPGGTPPRVAILQEPARELVPAASHLLSLIQSPNFRLWIQGQQSRVYVVESDPNVNQNHGVRQAGWIGGPSSPRFDFNQWGVTQASLPIDSMIATLVEAGGPEGFNLVVILSAGRVRNDQNQTAQILGRLPCHQVVLLRPQYHYADLGLRMQPIAPNWVEVALPF